MAPDGAKIDVKTGAASPAPAEVAPAEPKPAMETIEQKDARKKAEKARADDEARDKADADGMNFDTDGAEGPKGPEGAKGAEGPDVPAPEKSKTDKVIEYATGMVKSAGETAVKVYESIKNVVAGMSEKAIESLISFGYMIGKMTKQEWLTEWLAPKVKVIAVRKAMKAALNKDGKEHVAKSDNDEGSLGLLEGQYNKKLRDSGDKLTKETYSFEAFYQEKIDALASETTKKETYTIADLAAYQIPAEKKAAEEKEAGDRKILTDAKAVEDKDGVWTMPAMELGNDKAGVARTTIQFKKIDGVWQWRDNTEPAGEFNAVLYDTKDTDKTPKAVENRKAMNDLANKLGVKPKVETPVAPGAAPASTPDQKKTLREKMESSAVVKENAYLLVLASVLKKFGMTSETGNLDDMRKNLTTSTSVNTDLKTKLKDFFSYHATIDSNSSQEAFGIYVSDSVLKEGFIGDGEFNNDIAYAMGVESPAAFVEKLIKFEMNGGYESKETGYDLNVRAKEKIPVLQNALKEKKNELWGE